MTWLPIALMALGGLLIGGVLLALASDSRPAAIVLRRSSRPAGFVGGLVWLLGDRRAWCVAVVVCVVTAAPAHAGGWA